MSDQKTASDFSAKELAAYASDKSATTVERLLAEEKKGQKRKTAIGPLQARLEDLKAKAAAVETAAPKADETTTGSDLGTGKTPAGVGAATVDLPTPAPGSEQPQAGAPAASNEGDPSLERFDINADQRGDLQYPPDRSAMVDGSIPAPARVAGQHSRDRADHATEGPIVGAGTHRLAAPAPAEVPGAPPEWSHPDRHDARREPIAYPIAAPAPTQGPGVESPAAPVKMAGAPSDPSDTTPRIDYPQSK